MKFRIYRYDPDKDARPWTQDYDVELGPTDRMLLDALVKVKAADDSFAFRRSCREGDRLDYKPVKLKPLTAEGFEPKARVY